MIITTNLKLAELKNPPDLAHARIYDRILERCAPILCREKFPGGKRRGHRQAAKDIVNRKHVIFRTDSPARRKERHEQYHADADTTGNHERKSANNLKRPFQPDQHRNHERQNQKRNTADVTG